MKEAEGLDPLFPLKIECNFKNKQQNRGLGPGVAGGKVLPCMGYMGMCRSKGYGFQAVYSSIGYINQSVWV